MADLERFGRRLKDQIRRSDTNQSGLAEDIEVVAVVEVVHDSSSGK